MRVSSPPVSSPYLAKPVAEEKSQVAQYFQNANNVNTSLALRRQGPLEEGEVKQVIDNVNKNSQEENEAGIAEFFKRTNNMPLSMKLHKVACDIERENLAKKLTTSGTELSLQASGINLNPETSNLSNNNTTVFRSAINAASTDNEKKIIVDIVKKLEQQQKGYTGDLAKKIQKVLPHIIEAMPKSDEIKTREMMNLILEHAKTISGGTETDVQCLISGAIVEGISKVIPAPHYNDLLRLVACQLDACRKPEQKENKEPQQNAQTYYPSSNTDVPEKSSGIQGGHPGNKNVNMPFISINPVFNNNPNGLEKANTSNNPNNMMQVPVGTIEPENTVQDHTRNIDKKDHSTPKPIFKRTDSGSTISSGYGSNSESEQDDIDGNINDVIKALQKIRPELFKHGVSKEIQHPATDDSATDESAEINSDETPPHSPQKKVTFVSSDKDLSVGKKRDENENAEREDSVSNAKADAEYQKNIKSKASELMGIFKGIKYSYLVKVMHDFKIQGNHVTEKGTLLLGNKMVGLTQKPVTAELRHYMEQDGNGVNNNDLNKQRLSLFLAKEILEPVDGPDERPDYYGAVNAIREQAKEINKLRTGNVMNYPSRRF